MDRRCAAKYGKRQPGLANGSLGNGPDIRAKAYVADFCMEDITHKPEAVDKREPTLEHTAFNPARLIELESRGNIPGWQNPCFAVSVGQSVSPDSAGLNYRIYS